MTSHALNASARSACARRSSADNEGQPGGQRFAGTQKPAPPQSRLYIETVILIAHMRMAMMIKLLTTTTTAVVLLLSLWTDANAQRTGGRADAPRSCETGGYTHQIAPLNAPMRGLSYWRPGYLCQTQEAERTVSFVVAPYSPSTRRLGLGRVSKTCGLRFARKARAEPQAHEGARL